MEEMFGGGIIPMRVDGITVNLNTDRTTGL